MTQLTFAKLPVDKPTHNNVLTSMPYWARSFDLMANRNGFTHDGMKVCMQQQADGFVWQSHGPTEHSPIAFASEQRKHGQHHSA